ncbi:BZ3500_MvSof-1268-A1-R1_Chr5-3g08246 [Microbotryum saponariae]|uniref:BZ3500_MvSof-1268-A1-R1_Chr5-3g08246 protein n=1 Tax=Microbotryum saponariae TaxID=289078 RepID=A0A2X0LMG7_9BASI|nr:BZ3500_MvSof-1268-A1-R1_Chr5-3g08246 [Microbotryum saponariae]SDA08354.1 BZ3501_MvSof-1269-A2-R1_Chr5-3g07974 [Microbotryum saponariae]
MPSFFQTLLRKPSQSYQAAGPSAYDQAPPLPTARGGAGSSSRAPSLRQGAGGSSRSSYSHASSVNGDDAHTGAQGQQWSWDMYGSRKGSAGVGSNLHPSDAGSQLGVKRSVSRAVARRVGATASDAGSIRADSVYSNYEDDGRSLRSAKSHSSLRSAASVSSAWTRDQLNGSLALNVPGVTKRTSRRYTDVANTPSLRRHEASDTASIASSTASDYYRNGLAPSRSRSMSGPDPSTLKTSRKYSSASGTTTITTSGYQVVTTTEYTTKKPSSQRNKKTTSTPSSSYDPSLTGTDRTPSLYSTTSSTGSSRGALTPVYPTSSPMLGSPDLLLPPPSMSKDALKKEKRKKRTQGNTLIEEAVKRAGLPLDSVVELEEEPTTAEAVKQKATAAAAKETTALIKVLEEQQIEHGRKVETEAKPSKDGTSLATFDETASDLTTRLRVLHRQDSRTPSLSTTTTAASSEPLTPETETVSTYADDIPPSAKKKKAGPGDIPRIVTDCSLADDSDAHEIALNEATPTTPTTPVEVPRIQLTRTASDQLADRVQGDIDLSGYDSQSPRKTEGEVSRRSSTASRKSSSESVSRPVTSDPSVGSDSPRSKRSTRSASIDSIEDPKASTTTTTTAAQDQPQWMKRIKALGEPITPLVESPKLKGKTPEPHWTVKHHYEQQQQSRATTSQDMRRPASAGNLRRPKSIMEPMPEEREDEKPMPALPASSLALAALPISASRHAHSPSSPSLPSRGAFPTGVKERSAGKPRNPKPRTAAVAPTPGPPAILPHHVLAPRPDSLFLPSPIYYDASARQPPRPTSMHEVAASTAPTLESSASRSRSTSPPEAESASRAERTSLGRTVSLSQSAPASDSDASRFETAPRRIMSLTRRNSDNSAQMEFTPLPFPFLLELSSESSRDVPQAVSSYSDAGSDDEGDARSISGVSAMSMPVAGAHSRPPKNPRHEIIAARNRESLVADPIDFTATQQTTSLMTAVSVSAIAALGAQPKTFASGGSGWSLFKKAAPPLASTASPKKFDPLRDLTVSSMQPLPKKVKSDEVLVEVFAVPIERVDVDRAKKAASQQEGFGWIPGRGFYGKVVDTGLEVNKVKQGELVWGVQPLKKSGALADLITIHKSLVTPAPSCDLTVEQIATLPIAGAASLQVMEVLCSTVPAGAKILVLGAHIGVGNLCLQLARHLRPARDLYLVAQCPPERREDQVFCRESGASDVLLDDPLAAINRLHENEFDVVIDTIVYEAARRVLLNSGSFVTTVGESSAVAPTSSTQFKESVRSFRRNIFKKNKKHINYWFASLELDERDSTRDVLDRLRPIVEANSLMPRLGRLYLMKEACSAFSGKAAAEGGSVVRVKVV